VFEMVAILWLAHMHCFFFCFLRGRAILNSTELFDCGKYKIDVMERKALWIGLFIQIWCGDNSKGKEKRIAAVNVKERMSGI